MKEQTTTDETTTDPSVMPDGRTLVPAEKVREDIIAQKRAIDAMLSELHSQSEPVNPKREPVRLYWRRETAGTIVPSADGATTPLPTYVRMLFAGPSPVPTIKLMAARDSFNRALRELDEIGKEGIAAFLVAPGQQIPDVLWERSGRSSAVAPKIMAATMAGPAAGAGAPSA